MEGTLLHIKIDENIFNTNNNINKSVLHLHHASLNMGNAELNNITLLIDDINPLWIELTSKTLDYMQAMVLHSGRNSDRSVKLEMSNCDFNGFVMSDEFLIENTSFNSFSIHFRSDIVSNTALFYNNGIYFDSCYFCEFRECYGFVYDINGHDWISNITFINGSIMHNVNGFETKYFQLGNSNKNTQLTTTITFDSVTFSNSINLLELLIIMV